MSAATAANGKWREILPALGVPLKFLNGQHQPCPHCGGTDRARFVDFNGTGNFLCNSCNPNASGGGFELLKIMHGWDFAQAARAVEEFLGVKPDGEGTPKSPDRHRIRALEIWKASRAYAFDPVQDYLASRGIEGERPYSLRYFPLTHKSTPRRVQHPTMIAYFCAPNGAFGTLHRTYLADVTPRKMFWPGDVPAGGAIRLAPSAEEMGIAEGIETALSASALFNMPVWAATNDRMLAKWQAPAIAKRIWIFGDHDANGAGQAAAFTLLMRLTRSNISARVEIPGVSFDALKCGTDWNDGCNR